MKNSVRKTGGKVQEILENSRDYIQKSESDVRGIRYVIQIIWSASRKFLSDSCFIRANAISYSVVISIIPLLTVLVKYAEIDQDLIRLNLSRFLAAYGITDVSEVFMILDGILSRANAIAGAGSIFMIYAATNIIRHMEDSFNYIYRADSQRPLLYRFSLYISTLIVLPGVLVLGASILKSPFMWISMPSYVDSDRLNASVALLNKEDEIRIIHQGSTNDKYIQLSSEVELNAPFRTVYFELKSRKSGHIWEIASSSIVEPAIDERPGNDVFMNLNRISTSNNKLIVTSSGGVLFYSDDRGETWKYNLISVITESKFHTPILEDVYITEEGRIILLGTIGFRTILITKYNDEWSARPLDSLYRKIIPASMEKGQQKIFLGGSGKYLVSNDGGVTWEGPLDAKFGNRSVAITNIIPTSKGRFFAGDSGAIWLLTLSGKKIFPDIGDGYHRNIRGLTISESGNGFLYGEDGLFRTTNDFGLRWETPGENDLFNNDYRTHILRGDGTILMAGDNKTLTVLADLDNARVSNQNSLKILLQEGVPFWQSLSYRIVLYAFLFLLLFILFSGGYIFLPNAKVEPRPAIFGAILTAGTFLLFTLGFRIALKYLATTRYLYGVWAVIPVGMLIILVISQIILFGLEVAYVIQHPKAYRKRHRKHSEVEEAEFYNSALLLTLIYRYIYRKKRPLTDRVLLTYFERNSQAISRARSRLLDEGLMSYNPVTGEYFPVRPPGEIRLSQLREFLTRPLVTRSSAPISAEYKRIFSGIQNEIQASINSIKKDNISIEDLLKAFENKETSHSRRKKTERHGSATKKTGDNKSRRRRQ